MDFLSSSSPSNTLLLTTFLLISHFPTYGRAGRESYIIGNKGFKGDCAFHVQNYGFNLCPLAGSSAIATSAKHNKDVIKNGEIDSSKTRLYEIVLGGMSTEGSVTCDSETWVCMTGTVDGVPTETQGSKDLLSIPIARSGTNGEHGKIIVIKDEESSITLQLSLDGGEAQGRPQSAEIEMLCDLNVESDLEFINEHNGIHSFRWTTLHGCPTNIKRRYDRSSRVFATSDESADDDTESETDKGDDELLPQSGESARRWMAVILVIVVMTILCSSLLVASPRARHVATETMLSLFYSLMPIISTAAIKLRPLGTSILAFIPQSLRVLCGLGNLKPFRQGSNELVTWAEEDMSLGQAEADGYVEESWSGIDFDEYIPLTANPKHARNKEVKSYGATPETFEQRGGK